MISKLSTVAVGLTFFLGISVKKERFESKYVLHDLPYLRINVNIRLAISKVPNETASER